MAIQKIEPEDGKQYFPFMQAVVVFIFIKCVVEQILNLRQVNRFKKAAVKKYERIRRMPSEIRSLGIDPDKYKLAMQYEYEKLSFQMLVLSIKAGFDLIFTLTQAMPFIWNNVANIFSFISPDNEFQRGFAYMLLEVLRMKFIDIPIQLYDIFVIEEKYGFNKKTLSSFLENSLVEQVLNLFFIPVILYGLLYILDYVPQDFQLIMMVLFLISVVMIISTIFESYIQPFFNNYEELEEGELKSDIGEVSNELSFPLRNILKNIGGKQQYHSNASFIGMWKDKRIVIHESLLRQLSPKEVLAVVGHELGHWNHNHSYVKMTLLCIQVTLFALISQFFRSNDSIFLSFGFKDKSNFVGSALFYHFLQPMIQVFDFFSLVITRYFEFQADQFSCKLGFGYYLMSGLAKVQRENVTTLNPDPWYAWAKFSHPGLFERLRRIKQCLFQIEQQNGLTIQQIDEKIKVFMENYVCVGINHENENERRVESESNNEFTSQSQRNFNSNNRQELQNIESDEQIEEKKRQQSLLYNLNMNRQLILDQQNLLNQLTNHQLYQHQQHQQQQQQQQIPLTHQNALFLQQNQGIQYQNNPLHQQLPLNGIQQQIPLSNISQQHSLNIQPPHLLNNSSNLQINTNNIQTLQQLSMAQSQIPRKQSQTNLQNFPYWQQQPSQQVQGYTFQVPQKQNHLLNQSNYSQQYINLQNESQLKFLKQQNSLHQSSNDSKNSGGKRGRERVLKNNVTFIHDPSELSSSYFDAPIENGKRAFKEDVIMLKNSKNNKQSNWRNSSESESGHANDYGQASLNNEIQQNSDSYYKNQKQEVDERVSFLPERSISQRYS